MIGTVTVVRDCVISGENGGNRACPSPGYEASVRYVAEENIEIITPDLSESSTVLFKLAGKHFKKWDPSTRTFVSNIRDEYPDD